MIWVVVFLVFVALLVAVAAYLLNLGAPQRKDQS